MNLEILEKNTRLCLRATIIYFFPNPTQEDLDKVAELVFPTVWPKILKTADEDRLDNYLRRAIYDEVYEYYARYTLDHNRQGRGSI